MGFLHIGAWRTTPPPCAYVGTLVILRRGLPFFVNKEEERELSWWVQIGNVGRWGTSTVVCGWWLPRGTLASFDDKKVTHVKPRKRAKKGNE